VNMLEFIMTSPLWNCFIAVELIKDFTHELFHVQNVI